MLADATSFLIGQGPFRPMIKAAIRSVLQQLGFDLKRRSSYDNPYDVQKSLLHTLSEERITIFDIGANRGQCAKEYRRLFPEATIYCFEAFPESIQLLEEKFAGDKGVVIVPNAVADSCGRRTFFVNEFHPTNSLLPRPAAGRRYFPRYAGPETTLEVEAITVDSFLATKAIEKVIILKLDIQGGELMALEGSRKLLERGDVPIIYTEAMFVAHYEGGPLFHDLSDFLGRYHYSLYNLFDLHRAQNGQLRFGDALFVSRELREKVLNRHRAEP